MKCDRVAIFGAEKSCRGEVNEKARVALAHLSRRLAAVRARA